MSTIPRLNPPIPRRPKGLQSMLPKSGPVRVAPLAPRSPRNLTPKYSAEERKVRAALIQALRLDGLETKGTAELVRMAQKKRDMLKRIRMRAADKRDDAAPKGSAQRPGPKAPKAPKAAKAQDRP